MKEINLRIWDDLNKCWLCYADAAREFNILDEIYGVTGDGTINIGSSDESIIIELYISRKDKHNKEICAGDIVIGKRQVDSFQVRGIVVWSDANSGFALEPIDDDELLFCLGDFSELEILGNVHENLELLKEKDDESAM